MTNTEYFEKLSLVGWKLHRQKIKKGGQAHVIPVINDKGEVGVFRYLHNPSPQEIARFNRELKVLVNPAYQHPSIVEIISYSKDVAKEPWYISRWGKSFRHQWEEVREKFRGHPDELIFDAAKKLEHLCAGLSPLHDKGIVHRDIKLANVIATPDGNPVLIDFGVVYAHDAPRLTNVNEIVGNRAFSPDIATVPMAEVLPWIDVFQLAQMFMWMTSVKPDNDWQRPSHWRHVRYQPGISNDLELAVRALTAACSQPQLSPKNAKELGNLIRRLIIRPPNVNDQRSSNLDVETMRAGAAKGVASKLLRSAERQDIVDVSMPIFVQFQKSLSQELKFLHAELGNLSNQSISSVEFGILGGAEDHIRNPNEEYPTWPISELKVRASNEKSFRINIRGHLHLPSLLQGESPEKYASASHPYMFELSREADETTRKHFPERHQLLTIERDGSLILREHGLQGGEIVTLSGVRNLLRSWINEEIVWTMLYEND